MMSRGSSRESRESDDETTTDGATATAASRDGDSNSCRGSTARSLDSAAVSIFMLVITLFVLYIDDLVVVRLVLFLFCLFFRFGAGAGRCFKGVSTHNK